MELDHRPIIAFAKKTADRDYLKGILQGCHNKILFFENEAVCFDNLGSIDPFAIFIKTDSRSLVWRFVFALHLMGTNCLLIIVSDALSGLQFQFEGIKVSVHSRPAAVLGEGLIEMLASKLSALPIAQEPNQIEVLVGEAAEIKRINSLLKSIRGASDAVLIAGEAGTGKELLARRIAGPSCDGSPFVKVDCSYFETGKIGLFERNEVLHAKVFAAGEEICGSPRVTILFNRIDRLGKDAQLEVMQLLENGFKSVSGTSADWRVIATTEADLDRLVESSHFRQDLYYRLNVIPLTLPPLRRRREDIRLLIDYMTIAACVKIQRSYLLVSAQTIEKLYAYPWPGNVEELKRVMTRFVATGNEAQIWAQIGLRWNRSEKKISLLHAFEVGGVLDSEEIQSYLSGVGNISLKSMCHSFVCRTEKRVLQKALESTNWNRKRAAALLNISYKSMLNKIKAYDII